MDNKERIRILTDMLIDRCTPDVISSLAPNEVFVFGSNQEGNHKSRAAKLAVNKFGAVIGKGEGLSGQSYAIPVHMHHRSKMVEAVSNFIAFARVNPDKLFLVLAIGCGAASMDSAFVALMFRQALNVVNIHLPKIFIKELIRYYEVGVEISDDCLTLNRYPRQKKGKYIVPYGVESLGESSLSGCSCELDLPLSLKRIERWAFSEMGNFDYYIYIPSSVTFIDDKAFESEWCCPGMLVNYQSYAYYFAKAHGQRYKCVDFDEETYLKKQKQQSEKDHREIHLLRNFVFSKSRFSHNIPKGRIAIARNFAIVLNDDGHLTLLGHNDNFKQISSSDRLDKITAAFSGYMGLTERGRIITGGSAHEFDRSHDIERLCDVIDVAACEGHTIALMKDGSVECIDEPGGWEGVPNHSMIVRNWRNLKQVAVGFSNVMGLMNNGRVLYHSVDGFTDSHFYDKYSDIVQIDCYSHYYGEDFSMVLHKNGTVSTDSFKGTDSWKNIVQISVGADIAIGLKNDGTIEMVDNRGTRLEAKKWNNLVCIECKFFGVVGITNEGQILSIFS